MKDQQEEKLRYFARDAQYSRAKYMQDRPEPFVPAHLGYADNAGDLEEDILEQGNEDAMMEPETPDLEIDEDEVDWDLDETVNAHLYEIVPPTMGGSQW
jgi:hypothetical protein